jgi:hypothetical protein
MVFITTKLLIMRPRVPACTDALPSNIRPLSVESYTAASDTRQAPGRRDIALRINTTVRISTINMLVVPSRNSGRLVRRDRA